MKEIIQLLNSSNLDDRVLGIIMSVEQGVWEEIAKDSIIGNVVDSLKRVENTYERVIMRYKGRFYCLFDDYIGRYRDVKTITDVRYHTQSEIYYDDERENN